MNKENKRKKIYSIILALLLLAIISAGIYGYWAGNVSNPNAANDGHEITIGQGENVQTELNVSKELQSTGKKLVPQGKTSVSIGGANENVEEFVAKYTVKWVESGNADIIVKNDRVEGTLTTTKTNVTIGGDTANANLVNVEITPASTNITADGDPVEVLVKVTLTEPADKAQYDAVAGQTIKVDLNFSLAQ